MKFDLGGMMNRAKNAGGNSDKVALQPEGENTMMGHGAIGHIHILGNRRNGRE
jgi:hypothetical protein